MRRKNFKGHSIAEEENMKIVEAVHEKALRKEKLEEEKTKVVKEYVWNKNARRDGRGRSRWSLPFSESVLFVETKSEHSQLAKVQGCSFNMVECT